MGRIGFDGLFICLDWPSWAGFFGLSTAFSRLLGGSFRRSLLGCGSGGLVGPGRLQLAVDCQEPRSIARKAGWL